MKDKARLTLVAALTLFICLISEIKSQTCATNQFYNTSSLACQSCTSPCASCSNQATECNSCVFEHQYLNLTTKACLTCPLSTFYNKTTFNCQSCPNAPGFCLNTTAVLSCPSTGNTILNLETLKCQATCSEAGFVQVTLPTHQFNSNQALTICRIRDTQLGTIEYPYQRISMPFIEMFNFYDSFPNGAFTVNISAASTSLIHLNYRTEGIYIYDKRVTIDVYSNETNYRALINSTDRTATRTVFSIYNILPTTRSTYDTAGKLTGGMISEVQNSVLPDYAITVISGSLHMNRLQIVNSMISFDANWKFLNMDDCDGEFLTVHESRLQIQGIFSDIKNAVSTRITNNIFILSQTNYIITVRPSCMDNFDFTRTEFFIFNNTFNSSSTAALSYHLFFYKGFSNVTYQLNTLNNIVMGSYSHFAGQYVSCPGLMKNNTRIFYNVLNNFWDMSTRRHDARIDLQVQETNPNITFSIRISNNTFNQIYSQNYFFLIQNYNPSSYVEFSGNNFFNITVEDIAITFYTQTPIYIFDNFINGLYNRLRHFLYLDGPSLAHFKNMTINGAFTGLDYNAYALILADVQDGQGEIIFEDCKFTNWNIQMHYGINVAVKVKSFKVINTIFNEVKMLPLWHILNIKEASNLVIDNVTFGNFSFQAPKSSNGFAINVINLDVNSMNPKSIIRNVYVSRMSTNFFQLINAQSLESNITGQLEISNLTIENNIFDAEISLIQFSGFFFFNSLFDVSIINSKFVNNTFALYGNIISLKQNMVYPVTIKNSQFEQNFGAMFDLSSGNIALTAYPTKLKVDNCTFIKNIPFSKALIVVNENCATFIYNSKFLENYSVSRGSVIMADYQETKNYFENCTFVNNSASVGGVFYTQFGSMIDCLNCEVYNNFGIKGGVVYTSNDGYIRFRKSRIYENRSLYSSILVTLSSPTSYTEFSDSLIQNNILLQLSDFINENNTVTNTIPELAYLTNDFLSYLLSNRASIQNSVQLGLIYALNSISSNLKFENLIINMQDNILSSFEASIIGSNLTISNTIVTETQNLLELTSTTFNMSGLKLINISCNTSSTAKDKYLMSALLRSSFNIDNMEISNATNPIAFLLSSSISLVNSSVHDIKISSSLYQPLSLTDSIAKFSNVTLSNIEVSADAMIHLSFSTIDATQLKMNNINQTYMVASDSSLSFDQSVFDRKNVTDPDKESDLSSIDYVRSCLVIETSTLDIKSSRFSNFFTTNYGGAVSTTNCASVQVSSSYFGQNFAIQGGGLYLYCDEDQTCTYTLDNTTFEMNQGLERGGALHYNYFSPMMDIDNITFIDNIAPYGQNVSAFPFKLVVTNLEEIREQVSGQLIAKPIKIEVRDFYDNIINIDSSTKIELQSWNITSTQIQGASTLTVTNGQAQFDEVTLLSDPGKTNEYLKIVLQQYDNALISNAYRLTDSSSLNNLTVEIDFRECIVGEALQRQRCIKCPIGKFSLAETTSTCMNCPLNSKCPGGSTIDVDFGYWRDNYESSLIHQCLFSPACLGGTSWVDGENRTWPTACEGGYGGNLCHACVRHNDVMYTRTNKHECSQCSPNQTLNILRIVGIGLALIVAISILIILNLRRKGTNYLAVLMRMMTNYMQILSFAASFNLGWPQSLKSLYDSITIISSSSEMAFSLDCFFDNAGVSSMAQATPTYFIKALLLLTMPIMALVLILAVWGLYVCIKKNVEPGTFSRNTIVSLIVVIFLAHPTLTSNAFSMINCYEIQTGEKWLQADLEIMCWNSTHTKWFYFVGLPMLIIWVIGTPVVSLVHLIRNRQKLNDELFFSRYRMIYQGLRRKHFYWETVNTFRKISIVSINVFLALYPDYIKAIYAMLILAIIFKMQEILQPYEIPVFNWIEQREQIASIVTFYAGLYFVKADVSEVFKYVIIIIVFLVNAWFLVLWGHVALLQFRWNWTKKLAAILKKLICRKLDENDLKPLDDDAIGVSGITSHNTKQASQSMAQRNDQDFDDLNQSDRTQGALQQLDGEKSMMPLNQQDQSFDIDEQSVKKNKNKKKKQRKNSGQKSQTSSQISKEVVKGAILDKKHEVSSAFDEFSDRVENEQQKKEDNSTTKGIDTSNNKKAKAAAKKTADIKTQEYSPEKDEDQEAVYARHPKQKKKTVKNKKKKEVLVSEREDFAQPNTVSISILNLQTQNIDKSKILNVHSKMMDSMESDVNTHQNLKMPYAAVSKLAETKRADKNLKVKDIPVKTYDESVSSFKMEEDRQHVVKKRGGSKNRKQKPSQKLDLSSMSDDSQVVQPKPKKREL